MLTKFWTVEKKLRYISWHYWFCPQSSVCVPIKDYSTRANSLSNMMYLAFEYFLKIKKKIGRHLPGFFFNKYQVYILVLYSFPHFEYYIVSFFSKIGKSITKVLSYYICMHFVHCCQFSLSFFFIIVPNQFQNIKISFLAKIP